MRLLAVGVGAGLLVLGTFSGGDDTAHAHERPLSPLVVGSAVQGGGALLLVRNSEEPVAVTRNFATGGFVLYTATDPNFQPPVAEDPVVPLVDGTQVTLEVVAISDGVGVKLGTETLLAPGDALVLATAPDLHADTEWQLTLPEGESACRSITLRVTAPGSPYAPSEAFELQIANDPTTCSAAHHCGDVDGNGVVSVTDGVNVLRTAAGLPSPCSDPAPCDVDGSGSVGVTDGVNVLREAAGLDANLTCPAL